MTDVPKEEVRAQLVKGYNGARLVTTAGRRYRPSDRTYFNVLEVTLDGKTATFTPTQAIEIVAHIAHITTQIARFPELSDTP